MGISHIQGIAVSTLSHIQGVVKANISAIGGIDADFGGGGDTDAQDFLTAVAIPDDATVFYTGTAYEITGAGICAAVTQLVVDLKAAGVWTKLLAIYPFVGGTATSHKYNLKDPQDTDGAYRVVFSGSPTHDGAGVTGDGASTYGDTKFNQSVDGATDDEHFSLYSRTNSSSNIQFDMGVVTFSGGSRITLNDGTNCNTRSQTSSTTATATASTLGYFSVNRTASGGYRLRRNATNNDIAVASNVAPVNFNFYIMAYNSNGSATNHTGRNYAWFAIGRGLTETEDADLRTAVETFQDALLRGVI